MTINVKFDAILGKLRESDVGLVSAASISIPDPLIVNNLQVLSNASVNNLHTNTLYASTATIGNLTTNNIYNASTISTYIINTSRTDFNTSYVTNGEPVGSLYWNIDRDTLQVLTVGGEVDLGEDLMFYAVNQTGSTINKGTVVQFAGALGSSGKMLIAPAVADGSVSAIQILGITKETITDGDDGKVIMVGELGGIDTSVYGTTGTILYIDPATPGGLTNTEPTAPNLRYPIAATLDSKSNGNLIIRAIFNPNLRDLNDVSVISLASGQVLMANASGVWSNQTINVALPSLGSLAVQNTVDYSQITNTPSLGSLAVLNDLSYTGLLNLPSLGSLAVLNDLSYTSLLNLPSLGSLAVLNDLSYTSLLNLPSLGSLAVLNELSYTSLLNLPSLGSLAQISDVVSPLVLSGATLSLSQASIVHNNLGGLTTGDPHTQYVASLGRAGGQFVIGGTAANEDLYLYSTLNLTQGDVYIQNIGGQTMIGAGSFVDNENLFVYKTSGSADATNLLLRHDKTVAGGFNYGIENIVDVSVTTGTTDSVQGFFNYVNNSNLGTINFVEAFTQRIDNSGTGTIIDAANIKIFTPTNNGTIDNLYGIYIENQTGATNNYSIYSEGGDMYHAGRIQGGDGTAAAPEFSFINDPDTGMFRQGANAIGFATNGTEDFRITDTQALSVNGGTAALPAYSFTADNDVGMYRAGTNILAFATAGAEAARITATNRLGVNINNPAAQTDVRQTSATGAVPTLYLNQADLSEEFIQFQTTIGAGNPISTATALPAAPTHRIRVSVNGTLRFIYAYAA
jgi:hypothetical protein